MLFLYMQLINEGEKRVVITDRMWARLLSSTHQPSFLNPKDITGEREERTVNQTTDGQNHSETAD